MDQGHSLARLGKEHPFLATLASTMIVLGAIHHAQIGLDVLTVLVKHVKAQVGALDTSFRRFIDECTEWDTASSEDAHSPANTSRRESAFSMRHSDDPTATVRPVPPKTTNTARAEASGVLGGGR